MTLKKASVGETSTNTVHEVARSPFKTPLCVVKVVAVLLWGRPLPTFLSFQDDCDARLPLERREVPQRRSLFERSRRAKYDWTDGVCTFCHNCTRDAGHSEFSIRLGSLYLFPEDGM